MVVAFTLGEIFGADEWIREGEHVRCAVAAVLIAFSAFVTVCHFGGIVRASRRLRRDKNARGYALLPLVGGVSGAIGCLVAPFAPIQRLWWVPLVVDPGCALLLVCGLVSLVLYAACRRKAPRTPPTR
jgi:hypothetical protein